MAGGYNWLHVSYVSTPLCINPASISKRITREKEFGVWAASWVWEFEISNCIWLLVFTNRSIVSGEWNVTIQNSIIRAMAKICILPATSAEYTKKRVLLKFMDLILACFRYQGNEHQWWVPVWGGPAGCGAVDQARPGGNSDTGGGSRGLAGQHSHHPCPQQVSYCSV